MTGLSVVCVAGKPTVLMLKHDFPADIARCSRALSAHRIQFRAF